MLHVFIGLLTSFVYVFVILLLSKLIYKKNKELGRKFAHILNGNWWFLVIWFFEIDYLLFATIPPIVSLALVILSVRTKKGLISELERENDKSYGQICYSTSLLLMVLVSYFTGNKYLGGIGILSMAYGDGFAALIGEKFPLIKMQLYKNTKKSVSGSLAMFAFTFMSLCTYIGTMNGELESRVLISLLVTSAMATITELLSPYGTDNLTVPIVSSLCFATIC